VLSWAWPLIAMFDWEHLSRSKRIMVGALEGGAPEGSLHKDGLPEGCADGGAIEGLVDVYLVGSVDGALLFG
jgi:hypothetical protein